MADKRQRNYYLEVTTLDGSTLVIQPPFTLELDINRNDLSSTNTASLRIYNLSAENRGKIRKDQYDNSNLQKVLLRAGYGNNLPIILNGYITQAWSNREGVDFVTYIQAFDGGNAAVNSQVSREYVSGTPIKSIIEDLVQTMAPLGVLPGTVGDYTGTVSRGASYSGNAFDILTEITGGQFFVDNGFAHCLSDTECTPGEILTINSDNGLLGTPVREGFYLRFDMLFEPRLSPAQLIILDSTTLDNSRANSTVSPNFNGPCKIISIAHKAVISPAVSGDAITSVGLSAVPGLAQVTS